MIHSMIHFIEEMTLLDIIQSLTAIWVAVIATLALNTWKTQLEASKRTNFIDELTDLINVYSLTILKLSSTIDYCKISIDSSVDALIEDKAIENYKFIHFIKTEGALSSKEIKDNIIPATEVLTKIKALSVKGHILNFQNYDECVRIIEMLEWSYNQINAFGYLIGRTTLNWSNSLVQETIETVKKVNGETIRNNINQQNLEFINFAKRIYKSI